MLEYCCEKSNYEMSTTQNVILRVTIVLGMMAAVMAILYFSPLPDQSFLSCDRPCHDLDWPMICRITLEIKPPEDLSPSNITINAQIPGPSIQVCKNDILVVDVMNKIPAHSITIHWRGQPNNEAPFMDGTPLVTQCPIPSYTTFQYKLRASAPGTHFYHAYSDQDRSSGLFGALVVREADKLEPHRKLYDVDSKNHIILISESQDKQLLINGKTSLELAKFKVKKNRRYRFRVAFAAASSSCPVNLTIDNHLVKIIALDGNPTNPYEVGKITLGKGERVDFILKSNQPSFGYVLRVKSCIGEGAALLDYEGKKNAPLMDVPLKKDSRSFDTALCENKLGSVFCLNDVKSLEKLPNDLEMQAKKVLYLFVGSKSLNVNGKFTKRVYSINNLTFTYPSSPLLTQLRQISLSTVCDELNVPEKCHGKDTCECVHVEFIPLGALTEIILINQDEIEEEHIFHLHGYHFYVVGSKQFANVPHVPAIKLLNQQNELLRKNFNNPPLKDTIRIAKKSVVALRFFAHNPGFWILRDENTKGWTRGMDIVLQVGDSTEMVSTPSNFPTCGDYIGPDFFLM